MDMDTRYTGRDAPNFLLQLSAAGIKSSAQPTQNLILRKQKHRNPMTYHVA